MSPVLNASIALERFAAVFGPGAVHVIDYARARRQGSMLADLLAVAGLRMASGQAKVVNRMESLAQVEIIRGLNVLARNDRRLHGLNVRRAFWEIRDRCQRQIECIGNVINRGLVPFEAGDRQFDRILRSHVASRFPAQMDGVGLERKSRTHRIPNSDWTLSREAFDALSEIYERFRQDLWQRP